MSFIHFVRDSWLTASYYTGLSRLYHALAGRKRGIISYHNVLPISSLPPFDTYNVDVTAAVFDRQLAFLKKHFRVLPIQELENPDAKGLFLTVDDGMLNNYEILAPILKEHGLSALFAICPAMVDGEVPHIWRDHVFLLLHRAQGQEVWLPIDHYRKPFKVAGNSLSINHLTREVKKYVYENQVADIYGLVREICEQNKGAYSPILHDPLRYQFMNWSQIQDLTKRGHRVASHTMTHRILKFLPEDEKQYELVESKKRLENQLNIPVDVLVYPYGSMAEIDQATVNAAKEAGYQTALMNVRHHLLLEPSLTVPRFAFPPVADAAHLHTIVSGYKFLFR
ncbi:polysaccharide deacetylase family protein [Runella slithyformis]|uniref:Polysaccharide deacetylase n=1 Tax=Runella slithyformis (strain ATCC 29530 / DSM 19594 / LMG 11500 / NCIMB 11436 / LSU 4) TaxID=761193 RepID=A0A7U4E4R7_RUNSL|nr:polysaccharide deacetylase family protein [Runella slithyformis]AEI47428.1 polysaccharide deacetylase [Runella slithyformis DSM 19594]